MLEDDEVYYCDLCDENPTDGKEKYCAECLEESEVCESCDIRTYETYEGICINCEDNQSIRSLRFQ